LIVEEQEDVQKVSHSIRQAHFVVDSCGSSRLDSSN
jgi:hypothetical protein